MDFTAILIGLGIIIALIIIGKIFAILTKIFFIIILIAAIAIGAFFMLNNKNPDEQTPAKTSYIIESFNV